MKYLVTYIYDDWNKDNCQCIEICNDIIEVKNAIFRIKLGTNDDGNYQRNIRVFKIGEEITEQFDTKTKFDDINMKL